MRCRLWGAAGGAATAKAAVEGQIRSTWQGGAVTVLKSGYLLKKGSGLRKEWARRFFEVDSAGMLDYRSSKVCLRFLASQCCHRHALENVDQVHKLLRSTFLEHPNTCSHAEKPF